MKSKRRNKTCMFDLALKYSFFFCALLIDLNFCMKKENRIKVNMLKVIDAISLLRGYLSYYTDSITDL